MGVVAEINARFAKSRPPQGAPSAVGLWQFYYPAAPARDARLCPVENARAAARHLQAWGA